MKKPGEINFVSGRLERAALRLRTRKAMTLVEMVVAIAMVVIIFGALLPQFRAVFNGWDSKQASAEILQNGRILVEHLNNNLSRAWHITAVSPASQASGYIEFKDIANATKRYDIKASSHYVEFGTVGSLSELAGPVSSLQFTCYDACDIATTDITKIRCVQAAATFTNSAALGQSKTFTAQAYLRANYQDDDTLWGIYKAGAWFEFDTLDGRTPALCQIDSSHYLCAYEGWWSDGWSVVLNVNTTNWSVSKATPYQFNTWNGQTPALAQIDSTHYLCAYAGFASDGWSVVLEVNPGTWAISGKTSFQFDTVNGTYPDLAKIDNTHYLCAYQGNGNAGYAVVLEIDTSPWDISKKTPYKYDAVKGVTPAVAQIDATHYLCVYQGSGNGGWAVVLEVNLSTWDIVKKTPFQYEAGNGGWPSLVKIDANHYLCAYSASSNQGRAVVLTVDTGNWAIGKFAYFAFETVQSCVNSALTWLNGNHYACAYTSFGAAGKVVSLDVLTDTWTVSKGTLYVFDTTRGMEPALIGIDSSHCLCAYRGPSDDGWSGVFKVGAPVVP